MCHEPTPIAVGEAIVEAIVEVMAGVTHKVALWKDNQHPLVVPDKGGR